MKKSIIYVFSFFIALNIAAQEQVIDANLKVTGTILSRSDIYVGAHVEQTGLGNRIHLRGTASNTDQLWLAKFVRGTDLTDLRINIGDYSNGDRLVVGTTYPYYWREAFVVSALDNGRVGIGVSYPTSALDVNGEIRCNDLIRAKEVKIQIPDWSDFVFAKDYNLPSLSEVEKHIKEKQHLPDIPSEKEVKENGIDLGQMQAKLLQKIEELTLYVIELKKENESQNKLIEELRQEKTMR
ncbi:hypothetical protein [Prevotella sp. 10(H)]|uniref:hypothetical protein n=1 Tax=Prevotella sp. 10(H) TaxID=1158294 RepID=UPI0004A723E1|nr:hypothetical protein [Prevotella sp. 10(H)]